MTFQISYLLTVAAYLGTRALAENFLPINFTTCCNSPQEATAFAIGYALPLVAFENYTYDLGSIGENRILHQRTLTNPIQSVVRPNADTLYSNVFIDLSHHDVILTVPNIDDGRYYIFPAYDPYGNQFAEVSSVNKAPHGKYLLRRADDALVEPGLQLTPATMYEIPKYKGIINFPTTYGALVIRILLGKNTTAELDAVHAWQDQIKVNTTARTSSLPYAGQAPRLTPALLNTTQNASQAEKALELLARLGTYNQPEVLSDRYRVASILGQAGIVNNAYNQPQNVNLTLAYASALATVQAFTSTPENFILKANNWALQQSSYQGDFYTNYAARLVIALQGYLELVATEALYPTLYTSSGALSLGAQEAYLVTFHGKPPVVTSNGTGGFWSLTLYGPTQFLVPNELDRFEVGDRSALTYPDGKRVYPVAGGFNSSSGASNASRQFQVLVQPVDVKPPTNWTGNWLPAPAGGGGLFLTLRWYAPSSALINGSYIYPAVEKMAAITA